MNNDNYGFNKYTANNENLTINRDQTLSRVKSVHRDLYKIININGEHDAMMPTSFIKTAKDNYEYPTIGDFVLVEFEQGHNFIKKVLPRFSLLVRKKPHAVHALVQAQLLAANVDYIFIVTSMNKEFNKERLSRYLIAVYDSGAIPIIVLTKSDLTEDATQFFIALDEVAPGVDSVVTSALLNQGINELNKYLEQGNTVAFVGSSGVGKSSLINIPANDEVMMVKKIREDDDMGRHTTTHRQMILLPSGSVVIDTPGMREFGLYSTGEGVDESFNDIIELSYMCKFRDCKHDTEPGCAVKAAIENNSLDKDRLKQYNKMGRVKRHSDRKEMLQAKTVRNKAIAKFSRQLKKDKQG